jgi:hypothetical protein
LSNKKQADVEAGPEISNYESVVADIERVAEALSIEPSAMTLARYYRGGGLITEWQLRSLGGLRAIVTDAFAEEVAKPDLVAVHGLARRNKAFRKLQNAYGNEVSRVETFKAALKQAFAELPITLTNRPPKQIKTKKTVERMVIGHLSDIHFGNNIDPFEIESNQYNWTVAARRMGYVTSMLANYKLDHRDECGGLILNMGGDLAQGIIHADDANQDLLTWQFAGAVRYIVASIDYLLNFYDKIVVPVTPDNHMRILAHNKGKDKARSQKFDSFNTMMFEAIQQAFRRDDRVEFLIPRTPYTTFKVFGRTFFSTHGDTVLNLGSPSSSVDIKSIAAQIDRINAGLPEVDRIQTVLAGHVHTSLYVGLQNDVDLFINGSLSGTDPYAQSLGYMRSRVSQWVLESTRDFRVGDMRSIKAQEADDDDVWDEIIKPFEYSLVLEKLGY